MASASPLIDIDEQLLRCSICLDQLVEPKMLPCLHHFCRNCLHDTSQENHKKTDKDQKTKVECPTCRAKHDLPEKGVDGFKTDFNTKNIIEFVQLQDSFKQEPIKVCIHCTRKLKVTGYCFKCNDFLCEACHQHHMTNMIVKDHRPHIFSLSKVETKNITVERLSSLREAPRCQKHPGKLSELCCSTCGNLPICIACSYGAHRGHNLHEVSTLAETERAKLSKKMNGLVKYKRKLYAMQDKLTSAVESLSRTAGEMERNLREEHDQHGEDIKIMIHRRDGNLQKEKNSIEEMLNRNIAKRKQKLGKEIKRAQHRYDKACEEDRRVTDMELKRMQEQHDNENAGIQEKLEIMSKEYRELMTSLQDQQQKQTGEIEQMSEHYDDIVRRFESAIKMASSIIAAKNDWTDVQCIPDVCAAIDPLMGEVCKESPDLETLTSVIVKGLSAVVKVRVDISESEESIVDIRDLGVESGWRINGITGIEGGNLVITGVRHDLKQSFITVIDMKGELVSKNTSGIIMRCCHSLQQSKIVTACYPNEIGIHDVSNHRYIKSDISHIAKWKYIYCLTVNPANNDIIVGCDQSKDIYVFDAQLEHINTLKLPNGLIGPMDITVHGDNLLVCDRLSISAHAVTMGRSECERVCEFKKPNVSGITCGNPISVCTDRNSFIYMFWRGSPRHIIAQYSRNGRQLLATRLVDDYAVCMTTVETDKGEKLIIATYKTGKLVTYGISFSWNVIT